MTNGQYMNNAWPAEHVKCQPQEVQGPLLFFDTPPPLFFFFSCFYTITMHFCTNKHYLSIYPSIHLSIWRNWQQFYILDTEFYIKSIIKHLNSLVLYSFPRSIFNINIIWTNCQNWHYMIFIILIHVAVRLYLLGCTYLRYNTDIWICLNIIVQENIFINIFPTWIKIIINWNKI